MKWLSICCTPTITMTTSERLQRAAGREGDRHAGHAADPRADERDDVEQPGDHPDEEPELQADDAEPDRAQHADDGGDDELAAEEPADGAVEPVGDDRHLVTSRRRHERVGDTPEVGDVDQEVEGDDRRQHEDQQDVDDLAADAPQRAELLVERGALVGDRVLEVVAGELVERARRTRRRGRRSSARPVAWIVGHVVLELVDLDAAIGNRPTPAATITAEHAEVGEAGAGGAGTPRCCSAGDDRVEQEDDGAGEDQRREDHPQLQGDVADDGERRRPSRRAPTRPGRPGGCSSAPSAVAIGRSTASSRSRWRRTASSTHAAVSVRARSSPYTSTSETTVTSLSNGGGRRRSAPRRRARARRARRPARGRRRPPCPRSSGRRGSPRRSRRGPPPPCATARSMVSATSSNPGTSAAPIAASPPASPPAAPDPGRSRTSTP